MEQWKTESSTVVLENPWLKIRDDSYTLPNGRTIPHYYIEERADSAICVCVKGTDLLLVKQYRPGIQKATYCHPGGRVEVSDSSPVVGGIRELLEETGYVAHRWTDLGAYGQIPAVSTAHVHMFLVECTDEKKDAPTQDAGEDIRTEIVPISSLRDIIARGEMDCVACVAASLLALKQLAA